MTSPKLALFFAMAHEAAPFLEKHKEELQTVNSGPWPFQWFRGEVYGLDLLVALNGQDKRFGCENVGPDISSAHALCVWEKFRPENIMNAGTSGAFKEHGANIGDVYLNDKAYVWHDKRINLPGYLEFGEGHIEAADCSKMAGELGILRKKISTGGSLDLPARDLEQMKHLSSEIKEMEAASLAWAFSQVDRPLLALKAVTDLVDIAEATGEQFLKNFEKASLSLHRELERCLKWMAGNL